ncbi:MAG: hypothetical protein LBR76_05045 [Oscillospiraceae bacterium]|jgi:dipicolinate synthase subunit A|nr:hypothetical protein [Oscillospiraceae bacterium]
MRFSVMEGDARNARLYEILRDEGFEARLFASAEEAAVFGSVIVLPPKGVSASLFDGLLRADQTLVTGEDFLSREDFAILNAIATAEGALELAMRQMPVTLHGSQVLVIGYGRIGKLLCERLGALGASVTASARKNADFAWLAARGFPAQHTGRLDGMLNRFDAVFNTVPAPVLPAERLRELKPGCVVIDLASAPGGTDFKAAEQLGINYHWALSLPGRCSPESAARVMRLILDRILEERGVSP